MELHHCSHKTPNNPNAVVLKLLKNTFYYDIVILVSNIILFYLLCVDKTGPLQDDSLHTSRYKMTRCTRLATRRLAAHVSPQDDSLHTSRYKMTCCTRLTTR
ncbi:hypothetical protein BgiMline_009643 [Biomphalaria glabrata]|nr:hypothetical protein BgiMline_023763 [Biomphalaria glabrata]